MRLVQKVVTDLLSESGDSDARNEPHLAVATLTIGTPDTMLTDTTAFLKLEAATSFADTTCENTQAAQATDQAHPAIRQEMLGMLCLRLQSYPLAAICPAMVWRQSGWSAKRGQHTLVRSSRKQRPPHFPCWRIRWHAKTVRICCPC